MVSLLPQELSGVLVAEVPDVVLPPDVLEEVVLKPPVEDAQEFVLPLAGGQHVLDRDDMVDREEALARAGDPPEPEAERRVVAPYLAAGGPSGA